MKKYKSEIDEMLHEDFLADFGKGRITEAELREFEEDAFIDEDDNEAAADNVHRGKSAFKETVEASVDEGTSEL